jgi:hypothetical protein
MLIGLIRECSEQRPNEGWIIEVKRKDPREVGSAVWRYYCIGQEISNRYYLSSPVP